MLVSWRVRIYYLAPKMKLVLIGKQRCFAQGLKPGNKMMVRILFPENDGFKPLKKRYTWNPNDPCFGSKSPCFEVLTFKNMEIHWVPGMYLLFEKKNIYIYINTYSFLLEKVAFHGKNSLLNF